MEKVSHVRKSKLDVMCIARVLLLPNFIVLFWLVWTPNTSSYCGADLLSATEVFCLPAFWGWVGNIMLLMPTALLLFIVMGMNRVVGIAWFLVALPLVIEGVQNFIPGRDPDIRDFLVNSLGGISILYPYHRIYNELTK